MPLLRTVALLAGLVAFFVPAPSRADSPSKKPDLVSPLLTLADEHRNAKRHQEALSALRAAWYLEQRPEIACNRGMVAARIGLYQEAAEFLNRCLRSPPPGQATDLATIIEAQLTIVRQNVASISVAVNVPGADILIDGRAQGRTPLVDEHLFLDPGKHEIRADIAGRSVKETVTVGAGDHRSISLHIPPFFTALAPLAEPAKPMNLRPLVITGGVITGASVAMALGTLITSRVLYARSDANLHDALIRSAVGCTNPASRADCQSYQSNYNTAGTLQDTAIASAMVAGVAGIATITLAIINSRHGTHEKSAQRKEAKIRW